MAVYRWLLTSPGEHSRLVLLRLALGEKLSGHAGRSLPVGMVPTLTRRGAELPPPVMPTLSRRPISAPRSRIFSNIDMSSGFWRPLSRHVSTATTTTTGACFKASHITCRINEREYKKFDLETVCRPLNKASRSLKVNENIKHS